MARNGGAAGAQSPVHNWLKDLRFDTENYDRGTASVGGKAVQKEGDYQRIWEQGSGKPKPVPNAVDSSGSGTETRARALRKAPEVPPSAQAASRDRNVSDSVSNLSVSGAKEAASSSTAYSATKQESSSASSSASSKTSGGLQSVPKSDSSDYLSTSSSSAKEQSDIVPPPRRNRISASYLPPLNKSGSTSYGSTDSFSSISSASSKEPDNRNSSVGGGRFSDSYRLSDSSGSASSLASDKTPIKPSPNTKDLNRLSVSDTKSSHATNAILRSVNVAKDSPYPANRLSASYAFLDKSRPESSSSSPEPNSTSSGERSSVHLKRYSSFLERERAKLITEIANSKASLAKSHTKQENANPAVGNADKQKSNAHISGAFANPAKLKDSKEQDSPQRNSDSSLSTTKFYLATPTSQEHSFSSSTLPLKKSTESVKPVQRSASAASKVETDLTSHTNSKITVIKNENFGANVERSTTSIKEESVCPLKLSTGEVKTAAEIVALCKAPPVQSSTSVKYDFTTVKDGGSRGSDASSTKLIVSSVLQQETVHDTESVEKSGTGVKKTVDKCVKTLNAHDDSGTRPNVPKRTDSAEKIIGRKPETPKRTDSAEKITGANRPDVPKRTDSLKYTSNQTSADNASHKTESLSQEVVHKSSEKTSAEEIVQKPIPAKRTHIPVNTHVYVNIDSILAQKNEDTKASCRKQEETQQVGSTSVVKPPTPVASDNRPPESPYVNVDALQPGTGGGDSYKSNSSKPSASKSVSSSKESADNAYVNIDNFNLNAKTVSDDKEPAVCASPNPYVNLDTLNIGKDKEYSPGRHHDSKNASPYVNIDSLKLAKVSSSTHRPTETGACVTGNAPRGIESVKNSAASGANVKGTGSVVLETKELRGRKPIGISSNPIGSLSDKVKETLSQTNKPDYENVNIREKTAENNPANPRSSLATFANPRKSFGPSVPEKLQAPSNASAVNIINNNNNKNNNKRLQSGCEDVQKVSKFIGAKSRTLEFLKLNHGQICRVSFDFTDTVDDLFANAECLQCLDFSLKANVLQWQTELLYDCSSEEDEMQDFVSSLESINEKRMTGHLKSPTNSLPPRIICPDENKSSNEDIIIRDRSPDRRNEERAKTNCFDEMKKVEDSKPQRYPNIKTIYQNKDKRKAFGIQLTNHNLTMYFENVQKEVCLYDIQNMKPVSKKELTFTIHGEDTTIKLVFEGQKDLIQVMEDLHHRQEKKKNKSTNSLDITADKPEKNQIKSTLLKLLGKRSKRDLLERKGIIQNEAIFGNTLNKLYDKFGTPVPRFVTEVIGFIESEENITSMGLYRASGNLATMQKIRFDVDMHKYDSLELYKTEIDVLTGSLKMFFRELKEPLLPYETYKKLLEVFDDKKSNAKKSEKIKQILKQLPEAHYKTLICLIKHLIFVEAHKVANKMDTYNLSICWGPTLTWPSADDDKNESLFASSTSSSKVVEMLLTAFGSELKTAKTKEAVIRELKTRTNSESRDESPGPADSNKSLNREGIFGCTLELLCQDSKTNVPEFVTKMIDLIEKNITAVGIYRVSGNITKVEKIKRKVNKNKLRYLDEHKHEVFELTGAFKMFFRELYEPLLPQNTFENLILACCEPNDNDRYITITKQLDRMSLYHRDTLLTLLQHLVNVSKEEAVNRMSVSNLAQIWGPTLMYPCLGQKAEDSKNVLEMLIRYQMASGHLAAPGAAIISPNDSSLHRRSRILQQRKSLYSPSDGKTH